MEAEADYRSLNWRLSNSFLFVDLSLLKLAFMSKITTDNP